MDAPQDRVPLVLCMNMLLGKAIFLPTFNGFLNIAITQIVEGMFGFVADELWFHVALHILLDLVPSLLLVVNLLSFRRRSSNIGRAAISDNHDLFSTRRLFPNMPLHLRLNQELSLPLLLLFLS